MGPSRSNLSNPREWGSHFWYVMHTVAYAYPDDPSREVREAAKAFYGSLPHLLPCPSCGHHYNDLLNRYPLDSAIESRMSLVAWVVGIHNHVNIRLGKPAVSMRDHMLYGGTENGYPTPPVPVLIALAVVVTSIFVACSVAAYKKVKVRRIRE
eukprot:1752109-Pleurochrysis_carterae.AAC.3